MVAPPNTHTDVALSQFQDRYARSDHCQYNRWAAHILEKKLGRGAFLPRARVPKPVMRCRYSNPPLVQPVVHLWLGPNRNCPGPTQTTPVHLPGYQIPRPRAWYLLGSVKEQVPGYGRTAHEWVRVPSFWPTLQPCRPNFMVRWDLQQRNIPFIVLTEGGIYHTSLPLVDGLKPGTTRRKP